MHDERTLATYAYHTVVVSLAILYLWGLVVLFVIESTT